MSDIIMTPVRMERWLHTATGEAAKTRAVSMNRFMVAAIARAVSDVAATEEVSTGGHATYELTVRFNVKGGAKADDRAYDVMEQIASAGRIADAEVLSTDIARLAAMKPRST